MTEVYRDVIGYEGRYQVSNLGNVRSLDGDGIVRKRRRGQMLHPALTKAGYLRVKLCGNDGKPKSYLVHRLVAEAFIPRKEGCDQINHKNEIKTDNRSANLEWCDTYYNNAYGTRAERSALKLKRRAIVGIVIETGETEYYRSIADASRAVKGDRSSIRKALRGERSKAYGRAWRDYDYLPVGETCNMLR